MAYVSRYQYQKIEKNAFRVSKHRGETASRVRVPGGKCNAEVLSKVAEIARKYGNGSVHLTTRQGFEIEGISLTDIEKVNQELQRSLKSRNQPDHSRNRLSRLRDQKCQRLYRKPCLSLCQL